MANFIDGLLGTNIGEMQAANQAASAQGVNQVGPVGPQGKATAQQQQTQMPTWITDLIRANQQMPNMAMQQSNQAATQNSQQPALWSQLWR